MSRYMFFAIACLPALSGCTYTPKEVADPPEITLQAALTDVADSLDAVRQRTANRDRFGLIVDEVTVTFNISAKATNTGKLGITAANVGAAGIGLSADNTAYGEGNRGNIVVVKLKNLATADTSKANATILQLCTGANPPSFCNQVMNQGTETK